jgi:GNAT superfamily N-acetyltransferase
MIRIHESHDLGAVYAMDRLCFPADPPTDLRRSKWWIAKIDGVTAGYAGARALLSERAVYLSRVGVLEAYRGQGVQRALIRSRVRWAGRCDHITTVITDTAPANIASSNNLIRTGFTLYLPESPWCEGSALYWRKDL